MEERLFPHLLKNEPSTIEITKKEYDDHRDFEQFRRGGKDTKDVKEVLSEATVAKDGTPFSGTNKEIREEIIRRGTTLTKSQLNRKNKSQLLELL